MLLINTEKTLLIYMKAPSNWCFFEGKMLSKQAVQKVCVGNIQHALYPFYDKLFVTILKKYVT